LPDYGYNSYNFKSLVSEESLTECLCSPPAVQTAVAIAPSRDKIIAGEKVVDNPSLAQLNITDRLAD